MSRVIAMSSSCSLVSSRMSESIERAKSNDWSLRCVNDVDAIMNWRLLMGSLRASSLNNWSCIPSSWNEAWKWNYSKIVIYKLINCNHVERRNSIHTYINRRPYGLMSTCFHLITSMRSWSSMGGFRCSSRRNWMEKSALKWDNVRAKRRRDETVNHGLFKTF